ncbi:hypothetical protein [Wenjunlia tyrosinilytica]|uniref:Uncharacterized protein n=1 Tax=Wenjunlia tyrosinilytica TaxID=1544741 RepID=A0A917ZU63_9ACTN|nr:hypothetical protein [Wenjunlia tyrosinilytica]GGO91997.1 hypothetical protein GCM10012280_41170 [Wenjunlia tyrosinilytica]
MKVYAFVLHDLAGNLLAGLILTTGPLLVRRARTWNTHRRRGSDDPRA